MTTVKIPRNLLYKSIDIRHNWVNVACVYTELELSFANREVGGPSLTVSCEH